MTILLTLLFWYGLCFGIQHKSPSIIRGKVKFIDDLLKCSYCTGFHVGWITYLIMHFPAVLDGSYRAIDFPAELATWAFAAAAWCYVADALVQLIERR